MKIPVSVKINGIRYKVIIKNNIDFKDGNVNGLCDIEKQIIYINKKLSKANKERVLWHEMAHAWNIGWGENTVDQIAGFVTYILKNNKL